ncbi:MAG: FMN-binding negative transcriptional regulator [Hyphomonas sp.]
MVVPNIERMTSLFEAVSREDVVRFIGENPVAWIVPVVDPASAILMPLLWEPAAAGDTECLLGHLPRSAPLLDCFRRNTDTVCLFLGPHSYIPPGWVSKPDWAPTWNFVSLKISGRLVLDDGLTEEAVRKLVDHMEILAGSGWKVENLGERFHTLLKGIIGFRLQIDRIQPRFKVGQDETERSRAEISSALEQHPLQAWMR